MDSSEETLKTGFYCATCDNPKSGTFIMKRIEYRTGDKVGECYYIEERSTLAMKRRALFKCVCGNKFETRISDIKSGRARSCGCRKETVLKILHKTHGLRYSNLYPIWVDIKKRCFNKNRRGYKNYGGRGIIMYASWIDNFKAFYDYVTELLHYGEPGMTLDREKNNEGYFPGNVRWVSRHIQSANSRLRSDNTSGYRGVVKKLDGWLSQIVVNSIHYDLGTYSTPEGAVEARNKYIIENNLTEYKIQKPC